MKLDPRLLKDVLKLEQGQLPQTSQQWLGLPEDSRPDNRQLQQAYQQQLERLKQARSDYAVEQLRFASQQLRQAVLDLKQPAGNPPQAQPLPTPASPTTPSGLQGSASLPMAKPLVAAPVAGKPATLVAQPLEPSQPKPAVQIDTRRPVKKKRSRGVTIAVLALVLVGSAVGAIAVLQPQALLSLAQQNDSANVPEADLNADSPAELGTAGVGPAANVTETEQESGRRRQASGNRRTGTGNSERNANSNQGKPAAGNRPVGSGRTGRQKQEVRSSIAAGQQPEKLTPEPLAISQLSVPQWRQAAFLFESSLACIAENQSEALQAHLKQLQAMGDPVQPLVTLLQTTAKSSELFEQWLQDRLPLIQQVGELETGDTFISIIRLKPNDYAFRINGENRQFRDKDLPLGLKLDMFAAVIPDKPLDDVGLHVFKCLPYLPGNSRLKSSLKKRLEAARSMEEGQVFDADTLQVVAQFLEADGSVSQWIQQQDWELFAAAEKGQGGDSFELPSNQRLLEAIQSAAATAKPLPWLDVWSAAAQRSLEDADLNNYVYYLRQQSMWRELDSKALATDAFSVLSKHPDGKAQWKAWLTILQEELSNATNPPELSATLLDLGKRLARKFAGRQRRQWETRLTTAAGSGNR